MIPFAFHLASELVSEYQIVAGNKTIRTLYLFPFYFLFYQKFKIKKEHFWSSPTAMCVIEAIFFLFEIHSTCAYVIVMVCLLFKSRLKYRFNILYDCETQEMVRSMSKAYSPVAVAVWIASSNLHTCSHETNGQICGCDWTLNTSDVICKINRCFAGLMIFDAHFNSLKSMVIFVFCDYCLICFRVREENHD